MSKAEERPRLMRCPRCGAELPEGTEVCPRCGCKMEGYPHLHADEPSIEEIMKMKVVYAPPDILFGKRDSRGD